MRKILAMLAVACLLTAAVACDGPTVPRLPQNEEPQDTVPPTQGTAPTSYVSTALA